MNYSANKSAVLWSGVEKFSSYTLQFAMTVILGRLLSPDDYAVVAMLGIFFAISQAFIDSGMGSSLIQKQQCSQDDYNSVYYFNIAISIIIYLFLFFSAPFIEEFYGFPDLAQVLRVYALTLVIVAFSRVHNAIFCKELKFKIMAKITLGTTFVSTIVGIVVALIGLKYWALVGNALVYSIIMSVSTCYLSSWKPSLSFSFASLQKLAPLGLSILAISIFHAIYNNIYSFVIGKSKTSSELGFYDRGRSLGGFLPIGLSDLLTKALMPIQSKLQDDESALNTSYLRIFKLVSLIIIPVCLFISIYSKETLVFLIGEKWTDSATLLTFISIGYMFYPLQNINVTILKVRAKGKSLMTSEILKKAIGIIIVCITINFNLIIVSIGWMLFAIFEYCISIYYLKKTLTISLHKMAFSFSIILLKSFIAIAVSWPLNHFIDSFYVSYILTGLVFVGVYTLENLKEIKSILINI